MEASGKVEQDGAQIDVNRPVFFAMHTPIVNLWTVDGEMEGRYDQIHDNQIIPETLFLF